MLRTVAANSAHAIQPDSSRRVEPAKKPAMPAHSLNTTIRGR
jgi:hypothetical protein